MPRLKENLLKEFYHHWHPNEAKAIAACVYGSWVTNGKDKDGKDIPLPSLQAEKITGVKRPWLIYELYMKTVEMFAKYFEEHPESGKDFLIARWDPATRQVESGKIELSPDLVAETKEVMEALFGKGFRGAYWGNEEKLKEIVEGYGGRACARFFGEKHYPTPVLKIVLQDAVGFEDVDATRGKGSLADDDEDKADKPVADKKGPGRPKIRVEA